MGTKGHVPKVKKVTRKMLFEFFIKDRKFLLCFDFFKENEMLALLIFVFGTKIRGNTKEHLPSWYFNS